MNILLFLLMFITYNGVVSIPIVSAFPLDLMEGKFVLTYHEKERKITLVANRSKLSDIVNSISEKMELETQFVDQGREKELVSVNIVNKSLIDVLEVIVGHDYGLVGNKLVISSRGLFNGRYTFPIRPGTEEWAKFETVEEMYAATQIPEEILANMSTVDLLNTCLDYPLIVNIIAFDTLQTGFDTLVYNFNGLRELLTRKDATAALLAQYQATDYKEVVEQSSLTEEQNGDFLFQSMFREMLLAQDDIIARMTPSEQIDLVKESLSKFDTKLKYPEHYGFMSLSPTGFIMERVMENKGFATYNKEDRVQMDVDERNIQRIILDARKFVEM